MKIRLFKPSVGQEELDNIKEVIDRAWLGMGPTVAEFESEWNAYLGAGNSIGVNSGTAALHLGLGAFRFPPGSKVLVPAITFVSTATAVLYNGLEPVFVDVDPVTLSVCLQDLERKVTEECVALMVVHMGGYPAPMEKILDFACRHNLKIIEDCAHCAGGEYKGKKLGLWGDVGCFSFEEKKCMTTGDGGMISSNNFDLIEPLRAERWVGIDKDTWRRASGYNRVGVDDTRHWHYEVSSLAYKYNMNDLMAAVGRAQLKKLDSMNQKRSQIISEYIRGIEWGGAYEPLVPYGLEGSVYWLFGIRTPDRDKLIYFLKERGIATGVHFMPLPMHPLFEKHLEPIPVSREVWQTFVTLPLFPDLTDEEVAYVIQALNEYQKALLSG